VFVCGVCVCVCVCFIFIYIRIYIYTHLHRTGLVPEDWCLFGCKGAASEELWCGSTQQAYMYLTIYILCIGIYEEYIIYICIYIYMYIYIYIYIYIYMCVSI
jgi:hypothetical protein